MARFGWTEHFIRPWTTGSCARAGRAGILVLPDSTIRSRPGSPTTGAESSRSACRRWSSSSGEVSPCHVRQERGGGPADGHHVPGRPFQPEPAAPGRASLEMRATGRQKMETGPSMGRSRSPAGPGVDGDARRQGHPPSSGSASRTHGQRGELERKAGSSVPVNPPPRRYQACLHRPLDGFPGRDQVSIRQRGAVPGIDVSIRLVRGERL